MRNCGQNAISALMNCGKRAAKKTTALGLVADVMKPWRYNDFRLVRGACVWLWRGANDLRIIFMANQTKYSTPQILIYTKALGAAIIIPDRMALSRALLTIHC